MDTVIDRRLVGRVVAFIAVHVREGVVPAARLKRAYELTGVDAVHQRAVEAGLREIGVSVEVPAPPPTVPAETDETGPPVVDTAIVDEHRADGSTLESSTTTPTTDDRSHAMQAARLLLAADRRHARVARRILTAEQEVGLSLLFRGDVPPAEPLPSGFRAHLEGSSEAARAFDALVLHNQRLVWSVARHQRLEDLDQEDVVQAGYEGLIRAAERFDPASGYKFSTYATWWLRQSMSRAVANEGRSIRIPVHMYARVQKVMRLYSQILTRRSDVKLRDLAAQAELTPAQTVECLRLATGVISLDAPVADGDMTLNELLAGRHTQSGPEAAIDRRSTSDVLARVLDGLSDREALVMRLRHGLLGAEPATLDAIGNTLGITRERVRQIESKTLTKLRNALQNEGYGPSTRRPNPQNLEECLLEARSLPGENLRQRAAHLFRNDDSPLFRHLLEKSPGSRQTAHNLAIAFAVARYIACAIGEDQMLAFMHSTPSDLAGLTPTTAIADDRDPAATIPRVLAAAQSFVQGHTLGAAA